MRFTTTTRCLNSFARDGHVQAIDEGQVESLWIAQQLGRTVAKAWNAILSGTFKAKGTPAGDPTRLAIPVAADRVADRETAMTLVEDTGFDAIDARSLADSWRQQPGAPVYCTELTREEMPMTQGFSISGICRTGHQPQQARGARRAGQGAIDNEPEDST